jgi:uncharacterized protein (DUF58 family)
VPEIIAAQTKNNAAVAVEPAAVPGNSDPTTRLLGQRIALRQVGTGFSPEIRLAWVAGLLAVGACVAPWPRHGWLWFDVIVTLVILLAGGDALALWGKRDHCAPMLLHLPKGLRGREGQTLQIPLVFPASETSRGGREIRVGVMPATQESERAFRVEPGLRRLKLERPNSVQESSATTSVPQLRFWPWTPEISLLRRGVWPAPCVGIEASSPLHMWRLRQWFDLPEPLQIDTDLRPGRRDILRSPVYRLLAASQQTPWTGHGRDFERLREYQPGDNYSEIAWKSTARRGAPVTRLFQWEQKQEVYFVVDQSRSSASTIDPGVAPEGEASRAPRRLLDLAVETALVGATVALELGDEFGLVTYADQPISWLRAGSGRAQFHGFRERLLKIEPWPTTADYEALFGEIRVRLRRRAYLLLLADLTERSVANSLRRGVGLVRSSHALLMTSILPAHARTAFSSGPELRADEDVYAALAGEKENQRLAALARQMRHFDVQLRYVPEQMFLRTAVEGYLESKREQRL